VQPLAKGRWQKLTTPRTSKSSAGSNPYAADHLAHEVVDNSIDEALAGHCKKIEVTVFKDGSVEVIDDGRGMPVDKHPKEKLPGVEVILTKLHAGGKFSNKNYQFSGGLHGVGVSVVNALSKNLEVWIRRGGKEYNMSFAGGKKRGKLEQVGTVGKANTGTTIRFWPDPQYFDSAKFSVSRLKHALRAKAVLCPGLTVRLKIEKPKEKHEWCYSGGLEEYLVEAINGGELLPAEPFSGSLTGNNEAADWALVWAVEGSQSVTESYVNLIPTPQGGTHVNGLRTGLTNALREFCDFRNLLPRGVALAPEDVWDGLNLGTPVLTRVGSVHRRRHQGQFCDLVEPAPRDRRPDRPARDHEGTASPQGGEESRPQEDRFGPGSARQARGLHLAGARAVRDLPR
jgi:topoisomerase-4 subunit B